MVRETHVKPARRHVWPYRNTRAEEVTTLSLTQRICARPRTLRSKPTPQSKSQLGGFGGRGRTPLRMSQRRLAGVLIQAQ